MPDSANIPPEVNDDAIWYVTGIAAAIKRTPKATHHLLSKGAIKSARKIQGRWCASRRALLHEVFGIGEAA